MSKPSLSVVIVSYNTKDLTLETIESVGFEDSREIIVVDNHSSDGSVEALQKKFSEKIHIIARKDNAGFAVANNEGIKASKGEIILLLNSDTIVQKNALEVMVNAFETYSSYGILSCRLENVDGSFQPQGGTLPSLFNVAGWWLWPIPGQFPFIPAYQDSTQIPVSEHSDPVPRGWVGGTAMFMRRSLIDQIGYLDERIFMYAEDVDLCLRASQKGWKIGIVPSASIVHIGNASGSSSRALLGEIKGLLYLWKKHFSAWELFLLRLIIWKGALLRYLLFGILLGRKGARELYASVLTL